MSLHPMPSDPAPNEEVTRFLRHSNQYVPSTNRVKPKAFHPAPSDHKVSVFRIQGLTQLQIWSLGDTYVSSEKGLTGRADLMIEQINTADLQVESAEPPLRHANIAGWPAEKHEWMSLAQELAAVAILRLRER